MGIYARADSANLWMSLQVNGQRVRLNTGVSDRQVAEEIFAGWKVELARERWLGPVQVKLERTRNELIREYLLNVTPRKAVESQRRERWIFTCLSHTWGTLLLGELTPKMIDDYISARLRSVCFATVSKEMGILKSAYRYAIR